MKRQRLGLWAVCAVFLASGATWLVAMIWKTSALALVPAFAPHVVAAAITGLTLARALDRRTHAIALAVTGTLLWIGVELVAFGVHHTSPRWSAPTTTAAHYAVLALVCAPVAALAATPRLQGRPDHRLLWLWISALLMLGTMIASLTLVTQSHLLPPVGVVFIFVAPIASGALAQVLAPYRAIWSTGGGALVFVLIMFERFRNEATDGIAGPLLGMGMFVLLGALGARLGWRLFRNGDPRTPTHAPLPTARAQGDV